jgi:hypothetical protein
VNRIQQYRNIASRVFGCALDLLPHHGSSFAGGAPMAGSSILHFPSENSRFCHDSRVFSSTLEQNNFHTFCHFYYRFPRCGFAGRGIFGC